MACGKPDQATEINPFGKTSTCILSIAPLNAATSVIQTVVTKHKLDCINN